MNKEYDVRVSQLFWYTVRVEADDAVSAKDIVQKQIDDDDLSTWASAPLPDTGEYEINEIKEFTDRKITNCCANCIYVHSELDKGKHYRGPDTVDFAPESEWEMVWSCRRAKGEMKYEFTTPDTWCRYHKRRP